mgnify:CR=1 FL=1
MLLFALPIFISNLFQQLYNAADSLIVGNFLGGEALAAVGSSGSLIFLLTGFVNGVSLGAGVVVARYSVPRTGTECAARSTPPWRWAWWPVSG